MSDKKKISVHSTVDLPTAIAAIEDLVASLKAGTVCVIRGEEYVTLKPESRVEMDVAAASKKAKGSLKLELSWRHYEEIDESSAQEFVITSTVPEPTLAPIESEVTA